MFSERLAIYLDIYTPQMAAMCIVLREEATEQHLVEHVQVEGIHWKQTLESAVRAMPFRMSLHVIHKNDAPREQPLTDCI